MANSGNPPPQSDTSTHARLTGHGILLGRLGWGIIAVTTLGLFANSLAPGLEAVQANYQTFGLTGRGISQNLYITFNLLIELFLIIGIYTFSLILITRKSDNWVALLIAIMIITFGSDISIFINALSETNQPWYTVARFLRSIGEACAIIGAYVFPNGRFVPRWTRPLAYFLFIWQPLTFLIPTIGPMNWQPLTRLLWQIGWTSTIIYTPIHRYLRYATGNQRQQTKWVLVGIIASSVANITLFTFEFMSASTTQFILPYLFIVIPFQRLAFLLVPLTMVLSILRYRLWDIDFVINRGLVYGSMTLVLAGLFGGTLFAISQLFAALSGGQQSIIAVAATALVFGGLFQPARIRLQRFVDRRFFGIAIDYQKDKLADPLVPETSSTKPHFTGFSDLELIGRGGMAEVYKAQHPTLNRPVAIKVLPTHLARQTEFRRRFEREAQLMAKLKHPNIVQVFDFGQMSNQYFMILEYVSGPHLGEFLDSKGTLTIAEALPVLEQLGNALDYAHEQGMVHRDIKPANILLNPVSTTTRTAIPYRPVLTDFGIAKMVTGQTQLTRTGSMLGTFDYIAPEQIQGMATADHRVDVYAFGILTYRMLTGRLPFATRNPSAMLIAHLNQPMPDPRELAPTLPEQVVTTLQKVLSKEPEKRHQSVGTFVAALRGA